MNKFKNIQEF